MFFGPEFVKLVADFLYEIAMLIFMFASAFFCIALGADFLYEIAMLIFIFASAFFFASVGKRRCDFHLSSCFEIN